MAITPRLHCRRFICPAASPQFPRRFPFLVNATSSFSNPDRGLLFTRRVTRRSLSRPQPMRLYSRSRAMFATKVSSRAHRWRGIRPPPSSPSSHSTHTSPPSPDPSTEPRCIAPLTPNTSRGPPARVRFRPTRPPRPAPCPLPRTSARCPCLTQMLHHTMCHHHRAPNVIFSSYTFCS